MNLFTNVSDAVSSKVNGRSYAPTAACIAAALIIALFFGAVRLTDGILNSRVSVPQNLAYFCSDSLEKAGGTGDFVSVSRLSDIRITNQYLHVTGSIPASTDTREFVIKTDFAQIRLSIDGELIEDGIDEEMPFDDSQSRVITLAPSEKEQSVDLVLSSELTPSIQMYLKPAGIFIAVFDDVIDKIVWPAFMLIFVAALLFYLFRRKRQGLALAVAQILTCAGISLDLYLQYFDPIQQDLLKASALCIIAAGVAMATHNMRLVKAPEWVYQAVLGSGMVLWALFFVSGNTNFLPFVLWLQFIYHIIVIICLVWYWKKGSVPYLERQETVFSYFLFCFCFLGRAMPQVYLPLNRIYLEIICPSATAVMLFTAALTKIMIFDRTAAQQEREAFLYRFMPDTFGELAETVNVFFTKDGFLEHSRNVSLYVYPICLAAGKSEETAVLTAKAAFLHDIGKMMVPDNITMKETRLTNEEYEQMKNHALYGYNLLSKFDDSFFQLAAVIAGQHHERYDGRGYLGLAKDEVHELAALTSLADVFDAVTAERSYKKSWGFDEGFDYILTQSGSQFSPQNTEIFKQCKEEIKKIYQITRGAARGRSRLRQIQGGRQ